MSIEQTLDLLLKPLCWPSPHLIWQVSLVKSKDIKSKFLGKKKKKNLFLTVRQKS